MYGRLATQATASAALLPLASLIVAAHEVQGGQTRRP